MWSTWPQSRGVKQQYFDEKAEEQERATEFKLSTSWPQKTKGDRLLYVLNNKIKCEEGRIRINSTNYLIIFFLLITHIICDHPDISACAAVLQSVGILSSLSYKLPPPCLLLSTYYAGPSTSCFLQGVREQREGEAKGKLKRSARIYSRPDRGQKGEPCRPFPPDAGTPNTSQADKVNKIRWSRKSILVC